MTIAVSVVIPTYHRAHLLEACLRALARQTLGLERFEVIVSDDAPEQHVAELCARLRDQLGLSLRYQPVTECHGPAAARNQGWRAAQSEIIAFTDDDCVPQPRWLEEGIAALADAEVVAGRVVVPLGPRPTDYERDVAQLEQCSLVTANCFCRRQALQATGGFDERFRLAWREDSDLECMLRSLGFRIVRCDAAVVTHPVRPERFGVSLRQQRKGEYDHLLRRKHPILARDVIQPYPWWYALAVTLLVTAAAAIASGYVMLGTILASAWLCITYQFARRRLAKNSKSPKHYVEMVLTSAVIPWLSLWYQLRGWWRFRRCERFTPMEAERIRGRALRLAPRI